MSSRACIFYASSMVVEGNAFGRSGRLLEVLYDCGKHASTGFPQSDRENGPTAYVKNKLCLTTTVKSLSPHACA